MGHIKVVVQLARTSKVKLERSENMQQYGLGDVVDRNHGQMKRYVISLLWFTYIALHYILLDFPQALYEHCMGSHLV